jgi:hypothetical protein
MCGRRGMRRGFGGVGWSASPHQDGDTYRLACREVKVVGKPYEGKPHVRFEVAGGGNQDFGPRRHSLTLPADGGTAVVPSSAVKSEVWGGSAPAAPFGCCNEDRGYSSGVVV